MIFNPIIRKEVREALRTRKSLFMQVLFLAAAAALLWLMWHPEGLQDLAGRQSRRILSLLGIGEMVLVALFAPAFTAASLTGEKERNTYESLFATALKPWEIAVGKIVGSLTFVVLIVLSGAVALAAPLLLGGVSAGEVLAVLGVLLLTAVYLGMIGLFVSSLMHRSYRAIIVTYAVLLVVCFVVAMPAWPVTNRLLTRCGPSTQSLLHGLAAFSPLQAMISLVLPDSDYATAAQHMPAYWKLFVPLSLAIIAVTAAACFVRLRRPVPPPRPREKLRIIERGQISARTFLFIIDPRKRKKMIRWWQNPVLIKEFRSRPMLQASWLLRAVGIVLIVSVLLMFVVALSVGNLVAERAVTMMNDMAAVVASLIIVLIVLIGPALSAGAICTDRETGVWDLMRTTRLSSRQIVTGKFLANIVPLLLIALATAPAIIELLYFNENLAPNILRILAVVGMTILFVSIAGMFFSSLFARTSTATAWTYALVVTFALATLLMLLGAERFSPQVIYAAFVLNPVAAGLDAAGNASMQQYRLFVPHLKLMAVLCAVMFVVTVVRVHQLRKAK